MVTPHPVVTNMASQLMCLEQGCSHNREKKKPNKTLEMIQCTVCWQWYHEDCVGIKKDTPIGSWPCPLCRLMPSHVKILTESISSLMTNVSTLITKMNDMQKTCDASLLKLNTLQTKYDELETENADLRTTIKTLKDQIENKKKEVFTEGNCCHLVIGDSIIRSIDENKLVNTSVKCIPGADTADVMHKMNELDDIYMDVTICVGSNDCKNEDFEPAAVTSTYRQLVTQATEKVSDASKVVIVSVPPRNDSQENHERVKLLNASLCDLADESGATFINNDPTFTLQDGSPNDGYLLRDGLHLNNMGTNKLAKNMKLKMKNKNGDVCKDMRSNPVRPNMTGPNNNQWQTRTQHRRVASSQNCWNCGERNHISKNCRFGRPIRCNKCHAMGHKAKFCKSM